MKEFVEYLIKNIVASPDQVVVTPQESEGYTTYLIKVAQEDMGTVIGKGGKTINGIRNMAKAKAIIDNVHVNIVLEDQ
jgi:predicted RNA-binding protein YlqC (UPF0109 family)